jgi:hypothetical protein
MMKDVSGDNLSTIQYFRRTLSTVKNVVESYRKDPVVQSATTPLKAAQTKLWELTKIKVGPHNCSLLRWKAQMSKSVQPFIIRNPSGAEILCIVEMYSLCRSVAASVGHFLDGTVYRA